MLTLYTAVGHFHLNNKTGHYPIVVNKQEQHALDQAEMLLWSSLAFQFMTFPQVKQIFEQQLLQRNITPHYSFEHYLRRLLLRGLIVKGDGLSRMDALYVLLDNLYITPLTTSFPVRLLSSLHLFLQRKLTIPQFFHSIRKTPVDSPVEKLILHYCKTAVLSTSELLYYIDSGKSVKQGISDQKEGEMTCSELALHVHTHYLQMPILQTIGNLYLQKRILFHTL